MQDNLPPNVAPQTNQQNNVVNFRERKKPSVKKSEHPPLLNMPPATKILCACIFAIHLVIYAASYFVDPNIIDRIYTELGFVAARWTGHAPFTITALLSLITVNFLHAGWFHIGINVATLVAFGAGIEKRMGARNMLILFFLSSILAVFTHTVFSPSSMEPVVGASGGISGLFGALLVIMKHDGMRMGVPQRLLPMALMWIAMSTLFGVMGSPDGGSIAWVAHIGGFLGGMAIEWIMLKKESKRF